MGFPASQQGLQRSTSFAMFFGEGGKVFQHLLVTLGIFCISLGVLNSTPLAFQPPAE